MSDSKRKTARELAYKYLAQEKPLDWFEALYQRAQGDADQVPWEDSQPNPGLVEWLDASPELQPGRALVIGSGLGNDAEELARRGFAVTAFDISQSAIAWCRERFPDSGVDYQVRDLFEAPQAWQGAFDLVLESYTLQVLPIELRARAVQAMAGFVAPGRRLLVIARGREPHEPEGKMPWPLTRDEVEAFARLGLSKLSFEDYLDDEDPPVRRFRALFKRPA
jgi:SAM-dependent methyltransferase